MAFSSSCCLVQSPFSLKVDQSWKLLSPHSTLRQRQISMSNLGGITAEICGQRVARIPTVISDERSFLTGARVSLRTNRPRSFYSAKSFGVAASWFTNSEIASNVFTMGTVAVLPFYTFMVVAPKAALTKKTMESAIPYVVLGLLYGYLLYLSWTPETMQTMFASKYWLPEINVLICKSPVPRNCKDVLQRDDLSFCLDSFVGCRSLRCKASLSRWAREQYRNAAFSIIVSVYLSYWDTYSCNHQVANKSN